MDAEVEQKKEVLKVARKTWKKERRRWEKEWWDEILVECERAAGRGDMGVIFKGLKKLGARGIKKVAPSTTITTEGFREQFAKVSAERFKNPPEEIERAVMESVDLRNDPRTAAWRMSLNSPPEKEEVVREMKKMKDGAPGEDGARIRYILQAGEKTEEAVVELIHVEKWG